MTTLFRIAWLLLLGISLLTSAPPHEQLYILPGSTLAISGTSNVTDFACCCEKEFAPVTYDLEVLAPTHMKISDSQLRIPVQTLDCGNRIMNKDMREALRSEEHPYIDIRPEALNLSQGPPAPIGQWIALTAETQVTLAGTSKHLQLQVNARRLTETRWQIRSQKALCMLDFGIEPPTAMGGLIKVKDEITIHFDLLVQVP